MKDLVTLDYPPRHFSLQAHQQKSYGLSSVVQAAVEVNLSAFVTRVTGDRMRLARHLTRNQRWRVCHEVPARNRQKIDSIVSFILVLQHMSRNASVATNKVDNAGKTITKRTTTTTTKRRKFTCKTKQHLRSQNR